MHVGIYSKLVLINRILFNSLYTIPVQDLDNNLKRQGNERKETYHVYG